MDAPATVHASAPRLGHCADPSLLQRLVKAATATRGLAKHATCPPSAISSHLLEDGYDVRTIQELFGYKDVTTPMVYIQVLTRGGRGVRSPIDSRGLPRPRG